MLSLCQKKRSIKMNKPIHINDNEFENTVLKSTTPVVVDFWAPWCQPCRMIAPVLENLAGEYADKITVAKVDTDKNPEWAMKYGVQGIPTLLFIKDGQVQDIIVGVAAISVIKAKMDALLKTPVGA
ncbi:MAG: thioredoxin [Anaerolineales bacterium]|nr:thioredoxin [Anaerolineales bacterium]